MIVPLLVLPEVGAEAKVILLLDVAVDAVVVAAVAEAAVVVIVVVLRNLHHHFEVGVHPLDPLPPEDDEEGLAAAVSVVPEADRQPEEV